MNNTTRGGVTNSLPINLSVLFNSWKRLYEKIIANETFEVEDTSEFKMYCLRSVAAVKIQALFRGVMVRRLLKKHGPDVMSYVTTSMHTNPVSYVPAKYFFNGLAFILSGTVPSFHGIKYSQKVLTEKIRCHGGCVIKEIPKLKDVSGSVRYIVLAQNSCSKNVPVLIERAMLRRYSVVKYDYVFECMVQEKRLKLGRYFIKISKSLSNLRTMQNYRKQSITRPFSYYLRKKRTYKAVKKTKRK